MRSPWKRSLHFQFQHANKAPHLLKNRITVSSAFPEISVLWNGNTFSHSLSANFEQKRYLRTEFSKALVLVKDLKHLSSSPGPALTLGLSGLVPFVGIPGYMILSGGFLEGLAFSQIAYGACILSFVGAVRWGTALTEQDVVRPNWFNLGYSVVPSLVAWTALMLPNSLAIIVLMGGLAGTAYMDLTMFGYPAWFKALRFLLSLVAVLSLWTTLLCSFTMSDGKKKKKKVAKKEAEVKAPEPLAVTAPPEGSPTDPSAVTVTASPAESAESTKA